MATTNINIRIDDALKRDAEELFGYLGLSMSSAITMFLRSAVNNDGIPFELKRKEPNAATVAALKEADAILADPSAHRAYSSAREMMEDVLSDV
ncbi:MAG: type II toxin-antitoxin system RelB/DinJ family antitoxin [Clostridia bacterium]|nr:type II toxin-antitoxin system RelB/DinJ family antitoxin [Clostridia bacterium]